MEVSLESASPFTFERSGSLFRVKLINISGLSWISSFNCRQCGSKLLHGSRNVHYILNIAGRAKPRSYIKTGQWEFEITFAVFTVYSFSMPTDDRSVSCWTEANVCYTVVTTYDVWIGK